MKIAICPGSFDPVTIGHVDIIRRASKLFDKVIVVAMTNFHKPASYFTAEERVELLKRSLVGIENVEQAMEPLFTTVGGERSGLGFAVMESFMDKVKVVSAIDKGTTVTMDKKIVGKR